MKEIALIFLIFILLMDLIFLYACIKLERKDKEGK